MKTLQSQVGSIIPCDLQSFYQRGHTGTVDMIDPREVDAHYFWVGGLQECQEPLTQSRGGIEINPTEYGCQCTTLAGDDLHARPPDTFAAIDLRDIRPAITIRVHVHLQGIPGRYRESQFQGRMRYSQVSEKHQPGSSSVPQPRQLTKAVPVYGQTKVSSVPRVTSEGPHDHRAKKFSKKPRLD